MEKQCVIAYVPFCGSMSHVINVSVLMLLLFENLRKSSMLALEAPRRFEAKQV